MSAMDKPTPDRDLEAATNELAYNKMILTKWAGYGVRVT
jgi:hypothetical protein